MSEKMDLSSEEIKSFIIKNQVKMEDLYTGIVSDMMEVLFKSINKVVIKITNDIEIPDKYKSVYISHCITEMCINNITNSIGCSTGYMVSHIYGDNYVVNILSIIENIYKELGSNEHESIATAISFYNKNIDAVKQDNREDKTIH